MFGWLPLAVSRFTNNIWIVCSICPPLSIHMSRVSETASQHYHQNKPILYSITSVVISYSYEKKPKLLIIKVLSLRTHTLFNHCIHNISTTSLKHDFLFPLWGSKFWELHCINKFPVFKVYIWCCFGWSMKLENPVNFNENWWTKHKKIL